MEGIASPRGKLWSKGLVHQKLTSEAYIGTLVWGARGKYHRQAKLEPVRLEGTFPALIDLMTFDRVQEMLHARAPKVIPPRRVSSRYLLSGLLRCGGCRAAMFGVGAKSGQFHYYVCATAYRNGRQACSTKSIPQGTMESLVLERVQDLILRDKHLEELVQLTNEELEGSLTHLKERMRSLGSQLGDVDRRLERHYIVLETGKLNIDDLAPRIRELRGKRDLLQRARAGDRGRRACSGGQPGGCAEVSSGSEGRTGSWDCG